MQLWMCERHPTIPVAMARGTHPFSSRTRKLSLFALNVLGWTRPGRRWRRRISLKPRCECIEAFSVLLRLRIKGHMLCFCLQVGEITYKEYAHSSPLGEPCLCPFLRSRRQGEALGSSAYNGASTLLLTSKPCSYVRIVRACMVFRRVAYLQPFSALAA